MCKCIYSKIFPFGNIADKPKNCDTIYIEVGEPELWHLRVTLEEKKMFYMNIHLADTYTIPKQNSMHGQNNLNATYHFQGLFES